MWTNKCANSFYTKLWVNGPCARNQYTSSRWKSINCCSTIENLARDTNCFIFSSFPTLVGGWLLKQSARNLYRNIFRGCFHIVVGWVIFRITHPPSIWKQGKVTKRVIMRYAFGISYNDTTWKYIAASNTSSEQALIQYSPSTGARDLTLDCYKDLPIVGGKTYFLYLRDLWLILIISWKKTHNNQLGLVSYLVAN